MKKILFFVMLLLGVKEVSGQVTLEHTYSSSVVLFKVDETSFKYYSLSGTTLSIYSISHDLEKTIQIPKLNGISPGAPYLLSQTLFNSDSKYEFLAGYYDNGSVSWQYVLYDEDGNAIMTFDKGYTYMGAYNTSAGTKLIMNSSQGGKVYALNGKVYNAGIRPIGGDGESNGSLYPNPSNGLININHEFRGGHGNVSIISTSGQVVKEVSVDLSQAVISIDVNNIASGNYYYIITNGNESKYGSFVIAH